MSNFDRRAFLKLAGGTALTVSLAPSRAFAQSTNDHVLFYIFLRGAADGVSVLHPEVGSSAARTRYESWRRANGTRIANGIPVLRGLAMHPALAALSPVIAAGHFSFVPGVAGAVENRSHFQQQDLVESGASTSTPLPDGVLGRALGDLVPASETLGAIALTPSVPYALRRAGSPPPLSVTNFGSFGNLQSTTHRPSPTSDLQTRLSRLYLPASGACPPNARICQVGERAVGALDDLGVMIDGAGLTGQFAQDLVGVVAADTDRRIKMLSLDLGGWDTHHAQGTDAKSGNAFTGTLAQGLERVAGLLRGIHDAAVSRGVLQRMTTMVITEFGRTTFENGTGGTDHGYGSVAMVMGQGLRSAVVPTGWFPGAATAPFYATAESTRALPRLMDHRQVFAEILQKRFGVSNLSTALPGYTYDASAPAILR